MAGHDFIPLVTFRGCSRFEHKLIYGNLINDVINGNLYIASSIPVDYDGCGVYVNCGIVDKDSLGIYTGKNDKTKWEDRPKEYLYIPKEEWKGTPIFCGVAGAKYGSDILSGQVYGISKGKTWEMVPVFSENHMNFWFERVDGKASMPFQIDPLRDITVIGNQYERHLKEMQ